MIGARGGGERRGREGRGSRVEVMEDEARTRGERGHLGERGSYGALPRERRECNARSRIGRVCPTDESTRGARGWEN